MWALKVILVLAAVLLVSARVKEFKIESIEFTPGSEEIFTLTHTMTQVNSSTISMSGEYDLKQELDNTYTIQAIASLVTRGNTFFEVYRTKPQGVCDAIKSAGSAANFVEIPEICPVPATSGQVEDQVINFEKLMASGIAGRMKLDIVLNKDNTEKLRCAIIVVMK